MSEEKHGDDSTGDIILEECDSIAIVRLNRPHARNSLSVAVLNSLEQIVSSLTPRTDLDAIIFTGTGDVFASGANIRELQTLNVEKARIFAQRGQTLMQRIADAPQLTIAAINGYCMGGGLDLALACRVRCASPPAIFAHPGARLGIITGWGGTQRLPRLIGQTRALEMFTTARRLSAQEALEIGLISRICDPALDCGKEIVEMSRAGSCRIFL